MAVVIRLARFGTKHAPKYRITVADSRRQATGKCLEVLGYYNPLPRGRDRLFVMDLGKMESWISKGAQPSDRVRHIMKLAQSAPQEPGSGVVSFGGGASGEAHSSPVGRKGSSATAAGAGATGGSATEPAGASAEAEKAP